jgi:hypothetical protein
MRNTIKLQMQAGGGDTDIVAQGPLLVGAGIGFMKKLTGNLAKVNNTLIIPSNLADIAGLAASAMTVLDRTKAGEAAAKK